MFTTLRDNLAVAVAGIAVLALGTALVAQYVFGLAPCALCVWQRWPYVAALAVAALAFLLKGHARWWALAAAACFAATAGVGVFHAGVEQGLWQGLETCSGAGTPDSLDSLRAQVLGAQPARCDQIPFEFLGLSIAGWNAVYAGAAALVMLAVAATSRRSAA
ncbi:MAG: disulfide bond formation protein B [Minwuia sp.]|uniref:disulfide bond formation protein B n=1 Tax=Minwuia sp. TaxID=2493630 RepID=UPI003A86431B